MPITFATIADRWWRFQGYHLRGFFSKDEILWKVWSLVV